MAASTHRLRVVSVYAAIFLIFALVGAEIVLRVLWGLGDPALVFPDPDFGYAFQPNQHVRRFGHLIEYDANGLRSPPVPAAPGSGTLRILCLGDSVTNGGAATDQSRTYPYLLAARLRESGLKTDVLNASAGQWAAANELAFLKKRGSFHSQVIILQIGTHNLCQAKSGSEYAGATDFPDQKPATAIGELLTRYLLPLVPGLGIFHPEAAPAHVAHPGLVDPCPDDLRISCIRAIRDLIGEARSRGAKPLILLTVYRDEVDNQRPIAGFLRQGLFSLAQTERVAVEDMLPRLRTVAAQREDDFRDYIHPNATGNQRMAEAAAALIQKGEAGN
jgi:lysophospholipase L1-like esterase